MALTLAEASKLSNDVLLQGVVETIVKDSPVVQRLPFIEIVGNGLTYNQEKHMTCLLVNNPLTQSGWDRQRESCHNDLSSHDGNASSKQGLLAYGSLPFHKLRYLR